ncbi:MAG: tetraacyldisaccharide 4'-kinase [Calditerrivibrio sp.]|nr:tetraacyldisaccharide 4'-kinase [Calditerrivibrio sp.]MCA1932835.1 tetraacyldisaccharide 4'-kinase [Calditerrivibrio sp.]
MAKIISVGNISMGGTGKTPMVIKLGRFFIEIGFRVAVISRGYKGRVGYGLNLISDGESILMQPPLAADEPFLIATKLNKAFVVTCKDRKAAYNFSLEKFNPQVVILDDAFQHRRIQRDLDIVLLDYNNPISTGFIFPFGYLREFPSALKRADIILFTKTPEGVENIPVSMEKYIFNKPIFYSSVKVEGIFYKGEPVDKKLKFFAFSGIANNKSFFQMLENQSIQVVGSAGFRDHHSYSEGDFKKLKKILKSSHADLFVTTEKDFVKLSSEMKDMTSILKIDTSIRNEDLFFNCILNKIN